MLHTKVSFLAAGKPACNANTSPALKAIARRSRVCSSSKPGASAPASGSVSQRRELLLASTVSAAVISGLVPGVVDAGQLSPLDKDYKMELARRRRKIPIEEYSDGPQGLKYYDVVVGQGDEPVVGDRVAVHFDVKFRSITIVTSRAGAGVTGAHLLASMLEHQPENQGVRGMHVGGLRRLLVPPELAYKDLQVGEIPPNSTLLIDLELLSIKPKNPFGTRVKLVEG